MSLPSKLLQMINESAMHKPMEASSVHWPLLQANLLNSPWNSKVARSKCDVPSSSVTVMYSKGCPRASPWKQHQWDWFKLETCWKTMEDIQHTIGGHLLPFRTTHPSLCRECPVKRTIRQEPDKIILRCSSVQCITTTTMHLQDKEHC
jgi:hypothetical protein